MRGTPTQFKLTYIPALDGLRGVAVLAVMAFHAGVPFARGGFFGVDVFFVLSGFLITALLMQEWQQTGAISLGQFYARRALRLLPAVFVQLAIIVLVPSLFMPAQIDPAKLALVVMSYSANWVSAYQLLYLHVLQPTWSLAIEEQFYLLWPPLLVALLRFNVPRLGILGLPLIGIATAEALRLALWEPTRAGWARVYFGLDTRMDALLIGCLVGLVAGWGLWPSGKAWQAAITRSALASSILIAAIFYAARDTSPYMLMGAAPVANVAVAVIIIALLTASPRCVSTVLQQPPLVWIGRISYGLYLWHFPVYHGLLGDARGAAALGLSGVPLTLVRIAGAFAVATLSFYLLERPALRLKDRWRPQGSAPRPEQEAVQARAPSGY